MTKLRNTALTIFFHDSLEIDEKSFCAAPRTLYDGHLDNLYGLIRIIYATAQLDMAFFAFPLKVNVDDRMQTQKCETRNRLNM